jgi:hypothetical protein
MVDIMLDIMVHNGLCRLSNLLVTYCCTASAVTTPTLSIRIPSPSCLLHSDSTHLAKAGMEGMTICCM